MNDGGIAAPDTVDLSLVLIFLPLVCTSECISEAPALAGAKGYAAPSLHEARSFALALANASESYGEKGRVRAPSFHSTSLRQEKSNHRCN